MAEALPVLLFAESKNHFTQDLAERAGGVGLVGVDVHRGLELRADADNHVAEDQGAAVRLDLDGNDLLVFHAEFGGVLGREVNVALRSDHAFADLDFPAGADGFVIVI